MLRRSIDDPFDLTIEEKIFRGAKRACTVLAAGALTLSVLDLMNIHSVEAAAAFLHENSVRFAELPDRIVELPDRIREEIRGISVLPRSLSAQVAVSIPREEPAPRAKPAVFIADAPVNVSANSAASPIAELAAARHQDAIEMAMAPPPVTSPPVVPKPDLPASLEPAPVPAPNVAPMQFAAADTDPPSTDSVAPTPVSLPMSNALPLDMVPMPRPAPGVPPPSPAERLHLEGKDRVKAERCLANAVYFESRSEPVRGQMAVAQVIMNRAFSGFYPNDICGVVYQNADRHLACQFTFACDGKRKLINERGAWARANRIAKQTLDGQIYVPEVAKSTHYHAIYVHPNWTREMHKMVRYGIHNFYRPIAWGNGAEEPVWGTAALAQTKNKTR